MSDSQTRFAILLLAAVVLFGIVVISLAIVVRRRKSAAFRNGPGHPDVPAPTDPERRFAAALGAPYTRVEWRDSRGARRRHTPEQTYFGFASTLPPHLIATQLRRDWRVRKSAHAERRCQEAIGHVELGVQDLVQHPGEQGETELRAVVAFDIARFSSLVARSAAVGLITVERATGYSDRLGRAAASVYRDWDDYGAAYLTGLGASKYRRVKPYRKAVEWLRTAPDSPWQTQAWLTPAG